MIKIITSRAGYGKTSQIYQMLLDKNKKNELAYLMVPEQFTLSSEVALMEENSSKALINIQVMSFERLSRLVLSKTGGLKRPYIDEIGKHMALRLIFDKFEDEIPMYKGAYKKEGFLSEFCHTLTELKKMAIEPEQLILKSSKIENDALLKQKIYEIGFIYSEFLKYIDGKYVDNEDRIALLSEKINQATDLMPIEFYFDSFTGFTALELSVIEKLAVMGVDLCFSIIFDDLSFDKQVFSPTKETITQIQNIAKIANTKVQIIKINDKQDKSKEIRYLEESIYNYQSTSYEQKIDNIRLYQALDIDKEVEYVALEILSLVRDYDYKYKDILVMTPMAHIYASPISRIFNRMNLPYFIDVKRDIMSSPLIRLIFSYIDIHLKFLRYEDVFSFLKTDFTNIDDSLYMPLENFVLKWGIKGKMWLDDERFIDEKYFDKNDLKEEIKAARDYLVDLYKDNKKAFSSSASALDYAKSLYDFLVNIGAQEKNINYVDRLRKENSFDYANENAQISNILLDTLDQMVEIMGDKKLTLEDFKNVLYEGIKQHEIGLIPPALDQIIVATTDRSRSSSVRAMFFLGINDTYVPKLTKDSPILLNDDKKKLKDLGINLPSEYDNQMADETLAIYNALSKPKEKLYLSYSLSGNEENKVLRASTLIDRIKSLFPQLKEESTLSYENVISSIATIDFTFARLAAYMRDSVESKDLDKDWMSLYFWYFNNDNYKAHCNRLIDNLFYKNNQDYISKEQAKEIYQAPFKSSVSRLEKFAKCPFEHFVDYGLRPEPRKIHEIGALELGTIFHSAIEDFAKYANDKSNLPLLLDKSSCDKHIDSLLENSISNYVKILMSNSKRNAYMMNKIKKVGRRAAWTLVNQMNKGEFKSFDFEMKLPPMVIDLGEYGTIELKGQIDRVDILEEDGINYVKIIDYKSRDKKFSLSDAYHGIDIQLLVYLESVLQHLPTIKKTQAYPAGAFYFPIVDKLIETDITDIDEIEKIISTKLKMNGIVLKDIKVVKAIDKDIEEESSVINVKISKGEIKGENALEKEEFDALLTHTMKIVEDMSKEILKGNISIKPYMKKDEKPCTYCEHSSLCKFDVLFHNNIFNNLKTIKDADVKKLLLNKEDTIDEMD